MLAHVAKECAPAYEEHRLGLPLTAGERTTHNGIVLEKATHPITGVGTLRVVSGLPAPAAAAINGWLDKARRELDSQLRPYRGKMSAEQLSMLERQYLDRRLLEQSSLPRLSLFYLR